MTTKKTWTEFRECGLLWWINMILHTFGWAIVIEMEDGDITNVYPARVNFRGFNVNCNFIGYQQVSEFLKDNVEQLHKESLG